MKKSTMTIGWMALIPDYPEHDQVKGYSPADVIAKRKKMSVAHTTKILKRLKKEGKIKTTQARRAAKIIWLYKD